MAPRSGGVDPVSMVGRDRECATVQTALAATADGAGRVLLVGGDAGIGKTTLVAHAVSRATEQGFAVLEGACLDLTTDLPFAPVIEAVGPLARAGSSASGSSAATVLARAEAGDPVSDARLLGALREVLARAAVHTPVLLVLEDLHWAEPRTRDFVLAAARRLPPATCLLLTYRAEDVSRGHPLRRTLNDIATAGGCVRIDLAALDRAGLARLVEQQTGRPADPAYVASLLARSEGNPLFAVELMGSVTAGDQVPDHLADLLLARVDALPAPARAMVRAASVDGTRIDPALLGPATGRSGGDVETALREARDANVVVQHAGRLELRHALLRDAVYDDLLPGERARLHGAFADALRRAEDPPASLPAASRLAHHLFAAGDLPQALVASLQAAALAGPYNEGASAMHYERVLALWDRVPDPEALAGTPRADVLRMAAECHEIGPTHALGVRLIREALAHLGPDPDPLLACRVYTGYAGFWRGVDDEEGELAAAEKALAYAGESPSVELARILRVRSRLAMRHGRMHEGLALARRAREVARSVGDALTESEAVFHLALGLLDTGQVDAALAAMRECGELDRQRGEVAGALVVQGTLAIIELAAGHPQVSLAISREGATLAHEAALPEGEVYCGQQEVLALIWTGELDAAEARLSELVERGGLDETEHSLRADLQLARDDHARARVEEELYIQQTAQDPIDHAEPAEPSRRIAVFLAAGDTGRAVATAKHFLRSAEGSDAVPFRTATAMAAATALVAAQQSDVPVPPDLTALLDTVLERLECDDGFPWEGTMMGAELLSARAYRRRLAGDVAPGAWAAAVGAWRRIGFRPKALAVTVPLVEDLLEVGDRESAVDLLTGGWDEARTIGAAAVADRFEMLGRRARVTLDPSRPRGALRARLTRRELEVFDMVADGASNREVATALFISEKTVSVHMSNLMAKLGVGNRREASALALAERERS